MHIVEMNRERYEKALKVQKTQVAQSIVNLIQQSNGRFLKREPGVVNGNWILATQEEARDKISHFFRRLREVDAKSSSLISSSESGSNNDCSTEEDEKDHGVDQNVAKNSTKRPPSESN